MATKICSACHCELPATLEYFNPDKKGKLGLKSRCKKCMNLYQSKWRKKNPDKSKKASEKYRKLNLDKFCQYARRNRQENPEKFKEKDRRQYIKHRSKRLECQKRYRIKNKEKVSLSQRSWRERNQEYVSLKNKEWRIKHHQRYLQNIKRWLKEHPDKKQEYFRVREARKKALLSSFTETDWDRCKSYFSNSCAYCGKETEQLEKDHFIPLTSNGDYTAKNILPACKLCNSSKHNKDFFDWYCKQPFYSEERKTKILNYLVFVKTQDEDDQGEATVGIDG
jgi:hypothetical protein